MSEWIDFFIYAVLAAVCGFVFGARNAHFVFALIEDRNPGWLEAHPQLRAKSGSRKLRTFSYLWGATSILIMLCSHDEHPDHALFSDRSLARTVFARCPAS
jgi:hypothetical protein